MNIERLRAELARLRALADQPGSLMAGFYDQQALELEEILAREEQQQA